MRRRCSRKYDIGAPPLPESAVLKFLAGGESDDLCADLAELVVSQLEQGGAGPSDFEESVQIVLSVPALAKLQFGVFIELETQFTELIAERLNLDADDDRAAVIAAAFMAAVRVAGQRWSRLPDRCTFGEEVRVCLSHVRVA